MRGLTTNEERVKEQTETLNGKLDGYERILSKQKYLAGDVSTLPSLLLPLFCAAFSSHFTDCASISVSIYVQDFTLADLLHLSYGTLITEQCGFTALTSGELPNVTRWWADVSGRETWKEVIAERNAALAALKK